MIITAGVLAAPGVAAGGSDAVGGCPNDSWELIGTDHEPFLENQDRNGDGFLCRLPSKTPEGSPHGGSTITDNNRRV